PVTVGHQRVQGDRCQHGRDRCGHGQARVHRLAPASAGGVAPLAAPFPPWAPPSWPGPVAGPPAPAVMAALPAPGAPGPPRAIWVRLSMSQATLSGVSAFTVATRQPAAVRILDA